MAKLTAGLLVFRRASGTLEVLLAHPGGPFWARKDDGAWSIPKGIPESGEAPFDTARREFIEETSLRAEGDFIALDPVKQPGGKTVHAWAVECDLDIARFRSNTFKLEWPPRSGKVQDVPEIDRIAWFAAPQAAAKILKGQRPILDELLRRLNIPATGCAPPGRPGAR
ncbi:NUDIX domain-containing protein [Vineibacter terrae]|uniref:NUDIX domain-containing protein n=1 Tax=Vineibacter terrae TaxID=2586908 RepID=UPI002E361808|nr:NUDIX domain-containing protein [Vineibacter terrae]HEX2890326.1 NUDIX domain-containing protein [Vineibacter terrae]